MNVIKQMSNKSALKLTIPILFSTVFSFFFQLDKLSILTFLHDILLKIVLLENTIFFTRESSFGHWNEENGDRVYLMQACLSNL
jgi:hypothetical protein